MEIATIAAAQGTPVWFDRDATIEQVAALTKEAVAHDARLVAFPEAFVPTYPDWVWRTPPWGERDREWYARWFEQSVDVPGPACSALGAIAKEHECYLAVPVNERDGGTVYNTICYFGPTGELLAKHRKLVPTGAERTVWGSGDGSTLAVIDTPFGRVGGLICWESYMPLARVAMYEQHVDVLLAPTWDNSHLWPLSMQHIAKEGGCYVVGITSCQRAADVAAGLPGRDELYPDDDEWLSRGNTIIVDPTGRVMEGPLTGEPGILYAQIDADHARTARRAFDAVGHYARPDVFRFEVNRD
jgi:nitrilase